MKGRTLIAIGLFVAGLAPAHAQNDGTVDTTVGTALPAEERGFPWGLLGLIGLAGLIPLRSRTRSDR